MTVTSGPERGRTGALAAARVGVLAGGRSSEREVSLASGRAVLAALGGDAERPPAPDDRRGPAELVALEIDPQGRFAAAGRSLAPSAALELLGALDLVFLALHGGDGEGGAVQGFLRTVGTPFTGSDVAASAACLDKLVARELARWHGLRLAPGALVGRAAWRDAPAALLERLRALGDGALERGAGLVVKPRRGGSSVGVRMAASRDELAAALEHALELEPEALVEARVPGTELAVGVLVDEAGAPRALPAVEIRPHEGRFFDYEEKYSEGGALELCPPESVPLEAVERARAVGLSAHLLFGCEGYSRTDLIVPDDGLPVFLECNTLPGLTPRSLLPKAAGAEGLDHRALCLRIAAHGLSRGPRA